MARIRASLCAAALLAAGLLAAPAGAATPAARGATSRVVVEGTSPGAAATAVARAGGRVTLALPIVDGVAAVVATSELGALRAQPGVVGVALDRKVTVGGTDAGTSLSGTPSVFGHEVGADRLAAAGDTGRGAVVALVDTGVTPVDDLAGRLVTGLANPAYASGPAVDCIDFSGEGNCTDTYGHGTFMAGLIAGTGADSAGALSGVAPGARIISIKIAGRDGSSDVTKVLAAIQWVVSFRDKYGIDVLNLSLGTDSTDSSRVDPLDLAVERAWRSGIAVVVAAGNIGPAPATIMKPGDDPLVVTVGAADDRGTPASSDDRVTPFSSKGPTAGDGFAKPDVVAPGAHVISLQSPGSTIARVPTEADLTAPAYGGAYRRGSGTSMATAITSGVAALVWSRWSAQPGFDPATWPDRFKFALAASATPLGLNDPMATGAGLVNGAAAAGVTAGLANQGVTTLSDGSGSLDAARGDLRVVATCNLVVTTTQCAVAGQNTAEGRLWLGQQYATGAWDAQSWYLGQFAGQSWESTTWAATACPRQGTSAGTCAQGQSWEGQSWEGQSWEGYGDPAPSFGTPIVGSASYGAWG